MTGPTVSQQQFDRFLNFVDDMACDGRHLGEASELAVTQAAHDWLTDVHPGLPGDEQAEFVAIALAEWRRI